MYRPAILSRPIKSSLFSTTASFHSSRILFKEQGPLEKISDQVGSIKNALLENTPLKHLTHKRSFTGQSENWTEAIRQGQILVEKTPERTIDPTTLVGRDLKEIKSNITKLLYSNHPFLNRVAKHYFSGEGKHVRPLLVLLIAQATSIAEKKTSRKKHEDYISIDTPISDGLENITAKDTFDRNRHYTPFVTDQGCTILPTQRRLAEISEMIHTASLLHDDVIDASMTRRNLPSANASFGNKMAILGGDFMLGRASVALARLRNAECIELMATCIANLVEGEFMQLRNTKEESGKVKKPSTFDHYMEKTYMKTGSLIALSCQSSAVLGDATDEVATLCFKFGKHLGLAFQLIDDMLDFTVTAAELGKPAGADLKLGLATAPVLFAWEEFSELEPLIKRKFSEKGDEERARDLVYKSDGLKKTLDLAKLHCKYAIDELNKLPSSDARSALVQITEKLLTRKS